VKLLIATRNQHKLKEISQILIPKGFEIVGLDAFPNVHEVVEDRDTIEANAMKKALEMAQACGCITLADDTGLYIEALSGAPGVYAARFAGEGCSYEDNQNKALQLMKSHNNRRAHFKTAMALASPQGIISVQLGCVEGFITKEKLGDGGFGYDPVFAVEEYGLTYAQMSDEEKNKCSHRARALMSILPVLEEIWQNQ